MNRQIDIFDPLRDLPAFVASCESRAYAGIGSRETPDDVLGLMRRCAKRLESLGFVLRSGGAKKADEAFDTSTSRLEIFLPWPRFTERCGRTKPLPNGPNIVVRTSATEKARIIAAKHHPKWSSLPDAHRVMHSRSVHQVLGWTCDDPSDFVLCWTPDGSTGKTTSRTGGTGQAIRIAHAYGIFVFNLQRDDHRTAWEAFVGLR
jgi:hypothetical protein